MTAESNVIQTIRLGPQNVVPAGMARVSRKSRFSRGVGDRRVRNDRRLLRDDSRKLFAPATFDLILSSLSACLDVGELRAEFGQERGTSGQFGSLDKAGNV
jgi:hypothetical protein